MMLTLYANSVRSTASSKLQVMNPGMIKNEKKTGLMVFHFK